jgi:hypothetical protein
LSIKLSNISMEAAAELIESLAVSEVKDLGMFRVVEGLSPAGLQMRIITIGSDEALLIQ